MHWNFCYCNVLTGSRMYKNSIQFEMKELGWSWVTCWRKSVVCILFNFRKSHCERVQQLQDFKKVMKKEI